MNAATKLLLLRPRGVSPLSYLRSLSGKIVLWATQETTGEVAGAENDALTTPDTKQLATLTYAAYTPGAGWSNSGGQVALHTAGDTATLAQAGLLAVSKTYALTTIISGRTAGTVTPTGGAAISATTVGQAITATGTALVYTPTTDFDGSIDLALVVLKQTGIAASSDFYGPELYVTPNAASDPAGNEADATTGWVSGASAFTSDSAVKSAGDYSLKAVFAGASHRISFDLDTILTIGKRYKLTFRTRHLGSGGNTASYLAATTGGTNNLLVALTNTDITFQDIVKEFTHSATTRYLTARESSATNDGGVYLDNISLAEANPVNADTSGATIGQPMGAFGLGYLYDAVNDFLNWYSAEVNSMWNPGADFSIQIAFTSTSWAAGTATLFMAKVDANNFISITRNAADLIFNYTAGGTPKTVTIATGSPAGNNTAWLTVNISGDALNGYFNGVAGTPATTLGTFVGNLSSTECTVGASSTAGGDPWGGLGSQPYICDVVRTQTEITTHSNIAGVA